MGRPHLSVMGVVYEALGFAVARYGTILRISWLPLGLTMLLIWQMGRLGLLPVGAVFSFNAPFSISGFPVFAPDVGWITTLMDFLLGRARAALTGASQGALDSLAMIAGLLAAGAILQTSYTVPLVRAASGTAPAPRHSAHLWFGFRHLAFFLVSAGLFSLVMIVAVLAVGWATGAAEQGVAGLLSQKSQAFAEGSLHSTTQVQTYEELGRAMGFADSWLRELTGMGLSTVQILAGLPVLLVGAYAVLRLLPVPFLVAAGDDAALSRGLRLTGGINILPLTAIVILWLVLTAASLSLLVYGSQLIFGTVFSGSEELIGGFEGLLPEADTLSDWVRRIRDGAFALVVLAIRAFVAGLQTGLGGALVHAARRD